MTDHYNLLSAANTELNLGDGAVIVIAIVTILITAALIVLLWFRTKHERAVFKENSLGGNALTKENFDELLQRRFKYANVKTRFFVFYIQLNNAKEIKSTFGDEQYNTAINQLKARANRVFIDKVKLSNYTYDSIAVFFDGDLSRAEIDTFCRLIIAEFNKSINLVGNLSIEFDVNIGVAGYDAFSSNFIAFWQNLDLSTVAAVRKGVNTFVIHSAELSNQQTEEYKYYQEIKSAIEHNEFTVYFQTMVEFSSLKVFGYESLLRWNHPTLGVLSPDKFFNILEQSGDINWVGAWAFEQVMLQSTEWANKYQADDLIISINLSSKQLSSETLFDDIRQISRKYKTEPSRICFEIMEFAMFDKMETVRRNVEQLSKAGYLIAIDNYGLELNTLTVLQQIKVDIIKLDKEFINQLNDNSLNSGIVNMLINYAKENNIRLMAMGVETKEMLEYLEKTGIKCGQGYYFSKPRSAKECEFDFQK